MTQAKKTADAIGISLGTTNACAAGYIDGVVEVIPNQEGQPTTPASVSGGDRGTHAPGSRSTQGPPSHVDPVQVSAYVLMMLKEAAEQKLGKRIDKAVITVPAHFKEAQRQTVRSAARMAGFQESRLLAEPSAAALAYSHARARSEAPTRRAPRSEERLLVFQLGGGTFDVSCLDFDPRSELGSSTETLATERLDALGGHDFDNEIFDDVLRRFCGKHRMDPGAIPPQAQRRLRLECEKAKRALSSEATVTLEANDFHAGADLAEALTREDFERLCATYFGQVLARVEGLLMKLGGTSPVYGAQGQLTNRDPELITRQKENIHRCILVGGSARIPRIQHLLRDLFGQDKVIMPVAPEEAVALGAALDAALHEGASPEPTR